MQIEALQGSPPEGRICSLLMEGGGRRQNRDDEEKMLVDAVDAVLRHRKERKL